MAIQIETKVCEITYIQRGGDTVIATVHPRDVERRENGDIVFKKWDETYGMTSVWVSKRYLISAEYKTVIQKGPVDEA